MNLCFTWSINSFYKALTKLINKRTIQIHPFKYIDLCFCVDIIWLLLDIVPWFFPFLECKLPAI